MKSLLPALGVLLWLIALPLGDGTPTPSADLRLPAAESTASTDSVLVAAEGQWELTLKPTAVASCLSQRRFTLPSGRIFNPTTFRDQLTMLDDDTFQFRQDVFKRVPGTNRFAGAFTFPDASAAQAAFNLLSAATMRGQLVADYRVDTTRCSETVQFVFQQR